MHRATKLARILASPLWARALLSRQTAAAVEHCAILSRRPYHTVVDIGANRGQFALAARRCSPNARIVAFEPLEVPARTMGHIFARDPQVVVYQTAIGEQPGQATMHISRHDDSSSLLPIGPRQERLFPGTGEAHTASVAVDRLDHFLEASAIVSPALLKLDVQGFELQALRGCESLLHRFQCVYLEVSYVELYEGQALAETVTAWLEAHGYVAAGTYNTVYDREGSPVQADCLFERPNAGLG